MTTRELIEILSKMPQESIIILQKDSEGNGFSQLEFVDRAVYKDGIAYLNRWTAKEVCMEEKDWELFKHTTQACVILAPND